MHMNKVFAILMVVGMLLAAPAAHGTAWVEPRIKELTRKQHEELHDAKHQSPKLEEQIRANRRELGCRDDDKTVFCSNSPSVKSGAGNTRKPQREKQPTESDDSSDDSTAISR